MSLWHHLDKDGDGTISKEEWLAAFSVIDEDGNGHITRKEFSHHTDNNRIFDTIPKKSRAVITLVDWTNFFSMLDADASGTLETEELKSIEDEDAPPIAVLAKVRMFENKAKQQQAPTPVVRGKVVVSPVFALSPDKANSSVGKVTLPAEKVLSPRGKVDASLLDRTAPPAKMDHPPAEVTLPVGKVQSSHGQVDASLLDRTAPPAKTDQPPADNRQAVGRVIAVPRTAFDVMRDRSETAPSRDRSETSSTVTSRKSRANTTFDMMPEIVQIQVSEAKEVARDVSTVRSTSSGDSVGREETNKSQLVVSRQSVDSDDGSEVWEVEATHSSAAATKDFMDVMTSRRGARVTASNFTPMGPGPSWMSRISRQLELDAHFFEGDDDEPAQHDDPGIRKVLDHLGGMGPIITMGPCITRVCSDSYRDKKALWKLAAREVMDENRKVASHHTSESQHSGSSLSPNVPSRLNASRLTARALMEETRKSQLLNVKHDPADKGRASLDACLTKGITGVGYGTVGDHGVSQAARKFMAATIHNGWQVFCSGGEDDFEDEEMQAAAMMGYASLKHLLAHGGSAVVRIGVRETTLKVTGQAKAMFQALVPGSHMSVKEDYHRWNKPLRTAVLEQASGAKEAYEAGVEERMNHQVGKMTTILAALREDLPPGFGAVWVMTMLEAETKVEDCQKPPHFSLASFRYLGEDEFAMGAGGRMAQVATMGLKKHLEKRVTKLNLESVDYGPHSEPHPTLSALYARAFGFASRVLGKEKLQVGDDHRVELANFVLECKKITQTPGAEAPPEHLERSQQLIEDYDAGNSKELDGDKVWTLVKFVDKFAGGARSRLEAKKRKNDLEDTRKAEEGARWGYLDRQAGPDAIQSSGEFSLEQDQFDMMLPVYFDEMLTRGRWLCFRLESDDDSHAKYRVVPYGADDGTPDGGINLEGEFKSWQASQPTADTKPLCLANLDSMPTHKLRTARLSFNTSRKERFAEAVDALQSIDKAQTLCVHRFQGPIENNEEACLQKPVLYDLPTTWASSRPEPKVTLSLKALKMKSWLYQQKVLHSSFLIDSDPTALPDYQEAVKKARGR